MTWNDFKYAGVLRKYHSIVDVGGGGADDDNDAVASNGQQDEKADQTFEQARSQKDPFPISDVTDDDYIYDVEGRPVAGPVIPPERYQFYYKPVDAKRSSSSSLKRQQASGLMAPVRRVRGPKDPAKLIAMDLSSAEPEPRALPLLGSQAAVSKLNRQKETILKKILRQAGNATWSNLVGNVLISNSSTN